MSDSAPALPTGSSSTAASPAEAVAGRWRPIAAALGWTLAIVICVSGILLWARSGYAPLPQGFMSPLGFLALVMLVVTQATAGLILAIRRADNPIGLIIISFALAVSLASLANGYVALADSGVPVPVDPAWVAAVTSAIAFSVGTLVAVVLGMVFPDGRLLSPRWRAMVAISVIGTVAIGLGIVLTPGPLLLLPGTEGPVPIDQVPSWIGVSRDVIGPLFLTIGSVSAATALVIRYRQFDALGRLQLRWYIAAGVVLAVGFVAYVLAIYLPADEQVGEIVLVLFYLSASLPPVAMVFAILRYNVYGIDTILGRTFVYGALTAILAGLYTASVRLFNAVFVGLTGESSEIALVLSTLILATTFTPIKRRLEAVVDRRLPPAKAAVIPAADGVLATDPAALLENPRFLEVLDARIRRILDSSPERK